MRRADDLQSLGIAAATGRRAVQLDLRQAKLGARELAVIAGRLLGRPRIGGPRLLGAPRGLRGAALPVTGTRQRRRIDAADPDAGKMLRGEAGVVEETQRDPAGSEFLLGLVDVAGGQRGIARDQIGGAELVDVDHLARQQPPLDPPFVEIVQASRILRRAHHQLRGLGEFLVATQQLDFRKEIAGIGVQLARHRIDQLLEVAALAVGGNARLGQRDMSGAEALGGPHPGRLVLGAVEQGVHPRLVVARGQECAEHVQRIAFGVFRHRIVAPGLAHQPLGIAAVETGDSFSNHDQIAASSRLSSHSAASSRRRRKVCEGQLGLAARKAR